MWPTCPANLVFFSLDHSNDIRRRAQIGAGKNQIQHFFFQKARAPALWDSGNVHRRTYNKEVVYCRQTTTAATLSDHFPSPPFPTGIVRLLPWSACHATGPVKASLTWTKGNYRLPYLFQGRSPTEALKPVSRSYRQAVPSSWSTSLTLRIQRPPVCDNQHFIARN